jgi:hypothetical protein
MHAQSHNSSLVLVGCFDSLNYASPECGRFQRERIRLPSQQLWAQNTGGDEIWAFSATCCAKVVGTVIDCLDLRSLLVAGFSVLITGTVILEETVVLMLPELFTVYFAYPLHVYPTLPRPVVSRLVRQPNRNLARFVRAVSERRRTERATKLHAATTLLLSGGVPWKRVAHGQSPNTHPDEETLLRCVDADVRCLWADVTVPLSPVMQLGCSPYRVTLGSDFLHLCCPWQRAAMPPGRRMVLHRMRTAVFVDESPRTLLLALRFLLELDERAGGVSSRTLVVSPTTALPLLLQTLEHGRVASSMSAVRSFWSSESAHVCVVPHTAALTSRMERALETYAWRRIVFLDWPQPGRSPLIGGCGAPRLLLTTREGLNSLLDSAGFNISQLLGCDPNLVGDENVLREALEPQIVSLTPPETSRRGTECRNVHITQTMRASGDVDDDTVDNGGVESPSPSHLPVSNGDGAEHRLRYLLFGDERAQYSLGGLACMDLQLPPDPMSDASCLLRTALMLVGGGAYIGQADECPICFCRSPRALTKCGHWFCGECLGTSLQRGEVQTTGKRCPVCRSALSPFQILHFRSKEERMRSLPPFLRVLGGLLNRRLLTFDRIVVAANFGDQHERVAALLRSVVGLPIWAWRRPQQLRQTSALWTGTAAQVVLLTDPLCRLSRWLPRISSASGKRTLLLLLTPMMQSKMPLCCQVTLVVGALENATLEMLTHSQVSGDGLQDLCGTSPIVSSWCGGTGGCRPLSIRSGEVVNGDGERCAHDQA